MMKADVALPPGPNGAAKGSSVTIHSQLLTVNDIAAMFKVGSKWVRRHKYELGMIRCGKYLRFSPGDVAAYVAVRTGGSTGRYKIIRYLDGRPGHTAFALFREGKPGSFDGDGTHFERLGILRQFVRENHLEQQVVNWGDFQGDERDHLLPQTKRKQPAPSR